MKPIEKIVNFLSRDIGSFFKQGYEYRHFKRDDEYKRIEIKRFDIKTGEEVPYEHPNILVTMPRELLLD